MILLFFFFLRQLYEIPSEIKSLLHVYEIFTMFYALRSATYCNNKPFVAYTCVLREKEIESLPSKNVNP